MSAQTILILSPDPALRDLLKLHLSDEGYRVIYPRAKQGALTLIRTRHPDLLMVSLPSRSDRFHWRFIQQLHGDPSFSIPVVAVVDPSTYSPEQRQILKEHAVAVLPLVFDRDQLIVTVQAALTAAAPQASLNGEHAGDQIGRQDGNRLVELTRKQAQRLALLLGQRGLPSDTLTRINLLTEERRRILLREPTAIPERLGLLLAIEQQLAELWDQRRKELVRIDPCLDGLPPGMRNRYAASNAQTTEHY